MDLASVGIVVGVVIAVALAVQTVYWVVRYREDAEALTLQKRLGLVEDEDDIAARIFLQARAKRAQRGSVDQILLQAGSPYPLDVLYTRMAIGAGVGAVLAFALTRSPLIAMLGVMGFGFLPYQILKMQAQARNQRLSEQLPDALDLVSRSLQAGHGIADAMHLVADEMQPPISIEFGRLHEENKLGRDFRESFANLLRRNPGNFDLQIFAGAVLLARDTGGNLVEILNSISGTVRGRFLFQGKVESLTSEARFTGYVLGGLPIFIALFLSWVQPEYLRPLVTDPLGKLALGYCVTSFSLGVFVMREISTVDT